MPLTLDPATPPRLAIVGLGYVGLPLAIEFGKRYDTLGFDIDPGRIGDACVTPCSRVDDVNAGSPVRNLRRGSIASHRRCRGA